MSTKSVAMGSLGTAIFTYTVTTTNSSVTMKITKVSYKNTTSSSRSIYLAPWVLGTGYSFYEGTVAAGSTVTIWSGTKSKKYTRYTFDDEDSVASLTGTIGSSVKDAWFDYTIPHLTLYTLTYNPNGGVVSPTSAKIYYSEPYGTLPKPTRTGYTFANWWTAASGGTQVTTNTKMGAANTTIYAHWTINSYTLTYDVNGDGGTVSPTSNSINYGAAYILPTPTRTGYDFNGWWTAASDGTQVTTSTKMGAANTTIYAHWIEKTAMLTYNNGGYGDPPAAVTMYYTQATYATSMSADGWFFDNWVRSDNEETVKAGELVKAEDVVPTTLTLTAQWNPATVTITLNDQEATTSGTENFYEKYEIGFYEDEECETVITQIVKPAKDHYTFDGYYNSENGQGNKYIDSDGVITSLIGDFTDFDNPEGVTLYANWIPDIYQITLDGNDATTAGTLHYYEKYGVGNYSDENCTNEINRIEVPEKTGYTFNGYPYGNSWSIDHDGFIYGFTINGDTTLIADWTINQYTITAHANGGVITPEGVWEGTSEMVVKERNFHEEYGSLPSISRSGYILDCGEYDNLSGWYTAIESGDPVNMLTTMGAENIDIYPHWKAKNYNDENYNYTTIETGKVQAISNGSSYGLIPYAIEDGDDTLMVTSLQGCFEDTNIEGNLYVNCSAVTNVTDMFKEVSNNVCIIFGSEFQEFNTIWDSLVTENITYLGAEDSDYYYTADETNSSNHNLNIRVKDKSKEIYGLPILELNDGTHDWNWIAATMNQCYKDCINLHGTLQVDNDPGYYEKTTDTTIVENKTYYIYNLSTEEYEVVENPIQQDIENYYELKGFDEIFNGVAHDIYILCLRNDIVSTWEVIASLDDEGENDV